MAIQRPDTARLKAAAAALRQATGCLEQIRRDSSALEKEIKKAADALAERQLAEFLGSMSVDELSRDKRGIRVFALKNAGIDDLGQLYRRSRGSLESIPGIGETGAALIHSTVQTIAGTARQGLRLRLSAEDESKELQRLLPLLHRYAAASQPRMAAEELLADFGEEMEIALAVSKKALSPLGWLFSSAAERKNALAAAEDVLALSRCGITEKAALIHADFRQSSPKGDAMEAFRKNSAPFAIALEYVCGMTAADSSPGAVPAELAQAVNAKKLDLSLLRATLRPYQLFGTKYILTQKYSLLGDEMGLGKTVQAIAAMVSLSNTGETHFMVVCPASVVTNWCREIGKHSPLRVVKIHGSSRLAALQDWTEHGGVAVTTYETTGVIQIEAETKLAMMILDEAHYIKNPEARRTVNTKAVCSRAERLLFMTGTAMENKVEEMLELIRILQPTVATDVQSLAFLSTAPQFREKIAPVYYRRRRDDVLTELPELIEKRQWCTLQKEEERLYEDAILSKKYTEARRVSWNVADLNQSSKAQRLKEIIETSEADGRKIIVFSFFLDTIGKIGAYFEGRCLPPINGSVPPQRRQEIIDEFDKAPAGSVLLAQIQSGGTGLNIQSASVVVICEPQFKPSIENQAISRAYRMGQSRNVLVHRLLGDDTVDEKITQLLEQKQAMFDAFADESSVGQESLALDERSFANLMQEEAERIQVKREEEQKEQEE